MSSRRVEDAHLQTEMRGCDQKRICLRPRTGSLLKETNCRRYHCPHSFLKEAMDIFQIGMENDVRCSDVDLRKSAFTSIHNADYITY